MNARIPSRSSDGAIRRFFDDYARSFQDAMRDPPIVRASAVLDAFARRFIVATPAGIHTGKNGLLFRLVIPRLWARYRKIGIRSMNVDDVHVTLTDETHALARVTWRADYVRPHDHVEGRVDFVNHYWLDMTKEPRIFACVTPDEERILADHGLV